MNAIKTTSLATSSALLVVALSTLSGCSLFSMFSENKNTDYRAQTAVKPASLEVPPDLTSPIADDRFVIPDNKAVTYSAYNRDRANPQVQQSSNAVLSKIDGVRIERAGEQRWLVVKTTTDKAWAVSRAFWGELGYVLNRESPEIGIMETDWAEVRNKAPQNIIGRTVGRVVESLSSTGERDKFRTRLESGAEPGTVEIYISHRGLEENFNNADRQSLSWQPRGADKELEIEMLSRLMLKFNGANAAAESVNKATVAGAAVTVATRASFDRDKGGALKVNDPFDRAWRRVGLALDNIGFTVEDRDRSKGLFFVRYIDPDADAKSGASEKGILDRLAFWRKDDPAASKNDVAVVNKPAEKGFLDKLAFWRKDDPASKPQYRLFVSDAPGGAGGSDVVVQTPDGKPDNSPTAKRILSLLLEQLK